MGLLTAGALTLLPVAPAAAIQTIAWTTPPPASAVLGQQVSFAWSGTANTFLGARITGCFANYPNGGNFTNAFGGNFTTGNCNAYKTLTVAGTYPITVGFTLSTGGIMSMQWNVNVGAPTPTVYTSGNVITTATSVNGAPAMFSAYGSDAYYGTYGATCTPASGSTFPMGVSTVTCSATNAGGKTGSSSLQVTVNKADPTVSWSPPSPVPYGTTYGDLMTASMDAADASGTISYTTAGGAPLAPGTVVPVGANQGLRATYAPSGQAAAAYNPVQVSRTVTVEPAASAVAFASGTPTGKQYGDPSFPVSAEGTPGAGAVTITAQSGSTCTVSDPTTGTSVTTSVTLTGAGACVLLADQAATSTHTAAPTAQWSVTVAKGNPQITWTPPAVLTYGEPVSALFGAVSDVPGSIDYLVDGAAVAPESVLDVGQDRVISLVFTPSHPADYVSTTSDRTFTVEAAPQTLTVAPVGDQTYGDGPVQLGIGGTGPGLVSATSAGACTVDGLTVTLVSAGDCTVTVTKAATGNHLAAVPVTRTFHVAPAVAELEWDAPAAVTYGTALGATQLDATVTGGPASGGTFVYTLSDGSPALGQVLDAGDHAVTATWMPADPGWQTLTSTVSLHVTRAVPSLTWPLPTSIVQGVALGADQLNAVAGQPGVTTYTVDGGGAPALGQVLTAGDHVLHVSFAPTDSHNFLTATAQVPLTVLTGTGVLDNIGPEAQHQVDEQRMETQADLSAGETRTFSVRCPGGFFVSDGSARVDAVDQGTGTLADVRVLESRATSSDTWTVTMSNQATGRAQGKVFAECVQAETTSYDGHAHALVLRDAPTQTVPLDGPTTVVLDCGAGWRPVAPGYLLDGVGTVRRSSPSAESEWTFEVAPGASATTGTFSARCLADRVARSSGHDHRLVLGQAGSHVDVPAGQSVEAQTTCGDLGRGIVGGWSLPAGLVLSGAEPRAKTRASRLFNPTGALLSADLVVQCLETRTEGGSDGTVVAPPPPPPPPLLISTALPASRSLTVSSRARTVATVSCDAGTTTCAGTLRLVALRHQWVAGRFVRSGTVLARSTFALGAGSAEDVVLRATRFGRRVLGAPGLRRAQLSIGDEVRTVTLRRR